MVDDAAADDLPESDFMKAFKVASFEVEAGQPASTSPAKRSKESKRFWTELLADSVHHDKQAELDKLGKGMRERRQVRLPSPD